MRKTHKPRYTGDTRALYRQKDHCECCGWRPPVVTVGNARLRIMHLHHILPVVRGGSDEPENLILFCPTCHAIAHYLLGRKHNTHNRISIVATLRRFLIENGRPRNTLIERIDGEWVFPPQRAERMEREFSEIDLPATVEP